MKIATQDVGGEEVEITVDSDGRFHARFDEQNVSGNTLREVRDQLTKMNRKTLDARAIPVTIVGIVPNEEVSKWMRTDPFTRGIGVLNAKMRGKHGHTRQWMFVSEGANDKERKKFTLGGYGSDAKTEEVICRRISLEETLEYIRLAKAAEFAREQLIVWINMRRLNMKEIENVRAMEEAIEKDQKTRGV